MGGGGLQHAICRTFPRKKVIKIGLQKQIFTQFDKFFNKLRAFTGDQAEIKRAEKGKTVTRQEENISCHP